MKYLILALVVLLTSCNQKELETNAATIKTQAAAMQELKHKLAMTGVSEEDIAVMANKVKTLRGTQKSLYGSISSLKKTEGYIKYLGEGNRPQYIITFKFKKHRPMNFSITDSMKDEHNSFTLDIPVDKRYYDAQTVGSTVAEKFKTASMFISGKVQGYKVTIQNKKEIR